ncbi:MAG: dihydrodipicolinate synthase family protein [Pseudomonadota bacterium]
MERADRTDAGAALRHPGDGGVMLAGLSAFTLTPMDADGVVDTDHLGRLVARLSGCGVASIGVLGSTGSYMYLSASERARAIAAAVEAAGDTPVLAGIGALRTTDVMAHMQAAEAAGASAALLAPASYLPLTDEDFISLVESAASVSRLPICLYNNPSTTHFTMSEALVAQLATWESVAAVKNPAPKTGAAEQITRLRAVTPAGFVLGYSGDALIDGPLSGGADAWYSVLAGTLPEACLAIWAARGGDVAQAHDRLKPIWDLFNTHGSIRVVPHMLELLGLGSAPLPLPLQPLSNAVVAQIETALDAIKEPA